MKKIFLVIFSLCLISVTASIVYYFLIFLPQQQRVNTTTLKKIEQSTIKTEKNTQNAQPTTDTSNIQGQLDNLNNSIDNQNRDRQMQIDCEANNGVYQGNGTCVYNPR